MTTEGGRCATSSVETPRREEVRLPHEHNRIADSHCPRNADGSKDAYLIVMVMRGGPENAHIAHEIGLTVGRHDAAQRRPQPHDPDAPTDLECPLQPAILEKTLDPSCGFDDHVGAKAAWIKLGCRTFLSCISKGFGGFCSRLLRLRTGKRSSAFRVSP